MNEVIEKLSWLLATPAGAAPITWQEVVLYALLSFVAWVQAGPGVVLTLTLPGLGVSLLVLRRLYGVCVGGAPLATAPDEVRFDLDWMKLLGGMALLLPLPAILASRLLTPQTALLTLLGLVLAEFLADRRLRIRLG